MSSRGCTAIQGSFSAYLDGAMSGVEMQEIARHIDGHADAAGTHRGGCVECARELAAWRTAQAALAALGPAKAPADLPLRLRIAISHERVSRASRWADRLSLVWDNVLRPRLVHISAGFAGSMVLGSAALLLGAAAVPQPVLANDQPLGAMTEPHFLYSTNYSNDVVTAHQAPVMVEADIDAAGRVYDYTMVSGPEDKAVRIRVEDQLLSSVFEPATAFGVPVRGRVVITFAGVSARG
ncbi:MAG TPA: zf-HC2 domain-containing protein [Acidobacteriaceae bacterium]|nr:zf-HC2 domain-containing protein [Acidobacteriaceae bacterium]